MSKKYINNVLENFNLPVNIMKTKSNIASIYLPNKLMLSSLYDIRPPIQILIHKKIWIILVSNTQLNIT